MTHGPDGTDGYTVAAVALAAMCLVTFDHEALGHGGLCLALGGHIEVLTSAIFRCGLRSVWLNPAGPATSLSVGFLACWVSTRIPRRPGATRLFLILVAAFSFFWEAGYLVKAMFVRDGDLYFAAASLLGEPSRWWRFAGAAGGAYLYVTAARWAARSLATLFPSRGESVRIARIAWAAASLGAAAAALLNVGHGWAGFRDAVLEVGAASLPLLLIAARPDATAPAAGVAPLRRNGWVIGLSLALYALFAATLGRGLYA